MKEIKAFETNDGQIFTDYDKAVEHEESLAKEYKIAELVGEFFYNGIRQEDVILGVLSREYEFIKALKGGHD